MKKTVQSFYPKAKYPTYIIAEVGINHGGSLDEALRLIDSVARTGCDAVKFQTYLTEKRAAADSPIFNILKQCELPLSDFKLLKDHAEAQGLDFFSTPFDEESLQALESLDVCLYKIASFDLVNRKMLETVAALKKPVILSTGLSEMDEVTEAVNIFNQAKCPLALLHCVSSYPTPEEDANLGAIKTLNDAFSGLIIGQSDHTQGIQVPLYAVASGACIIEKHFCVDQADDCVDAPVSISEEQMSELVTQVRRLENIMGSGSVSVSEAEKSMLQFRRPSA